MSTNARLKDFALGLPEAWEDHPWGDLVVKVRKKIFVFLSTSDSVRLTVKLPVSGADVLTDYSDAKPTGYGLGRHGWVSITIPNDEEPDEPALLALIEESYRAVAPKTLARKIEF